MKYKDYEKKLAKLHRKLPTPPYPGHFTLGSQAEFEIRDATVLIPQEALRLGKWLVEFYGEDQE